MRFSRGRRGWWLALVCALGPLVAGADARAGAEDTWGPYNDRFLEGGIGVARALPATATPLAARAAWSIAGWLRVERRQPGTVIVAAFGDSGHDAWRGLVLIDGAPAVALTPGQVLKSSGALEPGRWYALAISYESEWARLYVDGRAVAEATGSSAAVPARIELAPEVAHDPSRLHFGGAVAEFRFASAALTPERIAALAGARPEFELITFTQVGVGWPWQERAWRGLLVPQDPWTLPHANTPPSAPRSTPAPPDAPHLEALATDRWTIHGWRMSVVADELGDGDGPQVSKSGFDASRWYAAVVPGTVLTTLIERGVYPDPDFGLNNLAIPDSLCRQNYWYRTEFDAPSGLDGRDLTLTFNGINYLADVWLNGQRAGTIKGAFTRGEFDITSRLRAGRNTLAVHISPPPHPGIPHEQSIAAGPGENGGNLAIDGPTFIATEGWDWIPGIRDRNAGIWQAVELRATDALRLLDPHVVTRLPLPATDAADVQITVAVENRRASPVAATVGAQFEQVRVEKTVTLPPGRSEVRLEPREFPQLHVAHPRLWWPNGYGPAELYNLSLTVDAAGRRSDAATLRFGIRELTYELSLFDSAGRLRRVEVDPTTGSARGERLVDVRHEAIKRTPGGWAASLTRAGETSPGVRDIATTSLTPYLAIHVNGVPIAVRGGSWGMDDSRKRVSRAHLEPFFRLHRAANLNTIRNWLGQDTEEVFYDLADEYGLLILNDFWVSTQDFQVEPEDPQLFLANARDVISRFRNHPSIAVWFGRNEGVPPPILNEGLDDLVATLDGTRYYTGSSNTVNLQGSGPYNYRPPEQYFTELARGFSVEVGTPSVATLEALQASIPAADRWPLGDTYAYHDWHFGGNGDVASYMTTMAARFGTATSFEDFERKAQLLDYESYRAIFEGFQAHLWTGNSGRLLWMTHPSWPSNTWQIYSSDYDTAAPYYAVKKACEPVHAQLNLPDFSLAVVNTTRTPLAGLTLSTAVYSLDNRALLTRRDSVAVPADAVSTLAPLPLAALLQREGLVLVRLTLRDRGGALVSENTYWQGRDAASHRRLNDLPAQSVAITAVARGAPAGAVVDVHLTNRGRVPVLGVKLTALAAGGERVLPAYYDDNYVTLLGGESRTIAVRCAALSSPCARIGLRGWNVLGAEAVVATAGSR